MAPPRSRCCDGPRSLLSSNTRFGDCSVLLNVAQFRQISWFRFNSTSRGSTSAGDFVEAFRCFCPAPVCPVCTLHIVRRNSGKEPAGAMQATDRTVYVGNVGKEVDEAALLALFGHCGAVRLKTFLFRNSICEVFLGEEGGKFFSYRATCAGHANSHCGRTVVRHPIRLHRVHTSGGGKSLRDPDPAKKYGVYVASRQVQYTAERHLSTSVHASRLQQHCFWMA